MNKLSIATPPRSLQRSSVNTVLGVNLRPFSIGHYLKLKRLGCAFVADDEQIATVGDVLIGVLVCSMSSDADQGKDEFWRWYHRQAPDGVFSRLAWYGRKLVAGLLGRKMLTPAELDVFKFGRRVGLFSLKEKAELFQRYITAHTGSLRHQIEPTKGTEGKAGAHWVHAMIATLTADCGYTIEEVYNVPFRKALTDYLKHAESKGLVRFRTNGETKFAEAKV